MALATACEATEAELVELRRASQPGFAPHEDEPEVDMEPETSGEEGGATGEEGGACCGYIDLWIDCCDWVSSGGSSWIECSPAYEHVGECEAVEGGCHLSGCLMGHLPECCYEDGSQCWGDILTTGWCPDGSTGNCSASFDQDAPGCDDWPAEVEVDVQ